MHDSLYQNRQAMGLNIAAYLLSSNIIPAVVETAKHPSGSQQDEMKMIEWYSTSWRNGSN